jgi:hypothetical protein
MRGLSYSFDASDFAADEESASVAASRSPRSKEIVSDGF